MAVGAAQRARRAPVYLLQRLARKYAVVLALVQRSSKFIRNPFPQPAGA